MNTPSHDKQDWIPGFIHTSPIFAPLHLLQPQLDTYLDWPSLDDLNQLKNTLNPSICTQSGHPIHFIQNIPQPAVFSDRYEPKIYQAGHIQTRTQNWHDFFNALVWMIFPRTKAALNHIHYQTMQQKNSHLQSQRGPLRDAATLLDESGVVVLSSSNKLTQLLKNRSWKELFWQNRRSVQANMKFFVLGHAIFEKSLKPYVGMTAKGVFLQVDEAYFQQPLVTQLDLLDTRLANFTQQALNKPTDLSPVPILGYPGWSKENNVCTYYDNTNYFRPPPT